MQTAAEFTSNLMFCQCWQFRHYLIYSQNSKIIFLVNFEQVFKNFYWSKIFVLLFCKWFITLFNNTNFMAM